MEASGGGLSGKLTLAVTEEGETTRIVCSVPTPSMNPFSGKVVELLAAGPSAS